MIGDKKSAMRLARKIWFPIIFGLLITAVLFLLGIVYGKSGDGLFSILLFPYTSLLALVVPNSSVVLATAFGYIFFLLQYPTYCTILNVALNKGEFYKRFIILLAVHVAFSTICLMVYQH